MEKVFVQLWEEVARLQELCSEQERLLQRLRVRKGPVLDLPELPPIQCTEDVVTRDGQRSPESHQNHPGALTSSTSHLEQPLEQPQASARIPLSPGDGAGTGGAAAFGSPEGEEEEDVPTWMRSWLLSVPWEGGRAPCSPQELETPNPGAGGSFPDLLDLYKAPEALEKEDAPRAGALPGEALVEIRGPVKTCWTPGWALEEETPGTSPSCGAAPARDLCQEIFPSDPAGHVEYLNHLMARLE